MRSRVDQRFRVCFRRLPKHARKAAFADYRLWRIDPFANGLHFKEVVEKHYIWSVRAGISYRALGKKIESDLIVWFWVGSHSDYDKLLEQWQKASNAKAPKVQ